MRYILQYSKRAVQDLDRVFAEVLEASQDWETALNYLDDLLEKVEKKADYPRSASPLYYEDLFTGYYFIVFKAYLVFYRLEKDRMLIDRVLYRRSDYMRTLFDAFDTE